MYTSVSLWTVMLIFLPILCFLLLFVCFCVLGGDTGGPAYRQSFLKASLIWGTWLVAVTELLSLFQQIAFGPVVTSWVLACLMPALFLLLVKRPRTDLFRPLIDKVRTMPRDWAFNMAAVAGIVAVVGLVAIVAPPNNFDSLAYHMGRVVHWIQNRSVAHYSTSINRQLYLSPGAEFIILHLQIVSQSDRFANLVQWFSMVGSIIGISLITQELGGGADSQRLAALLAATLPIGILEGSTTQNDWVVAFWLIGFAYYVLRSFGENSGLPDTLLAGTALGLAVLTKPTAGLYAPPFILWYAIVRRRKTIRRYWTEGLLMTLLVIALNATHWHRNISWTGRILGTSYDATISVFKAKLFVSNALRMLAMQFSLYFCRPTLLYYKAIRVLHHLAGVDINDPRITYASTHFIIPTGTRLVHEDFSVNPFHTLLLAASWVWLFTRPGLAKNKRLMVYGVASVSGFSLLSLLLKWTPWTTRLMLPWFALMFPFVALVSTAVLSRRALRLIANGFVLASLPWVFDNYSRPLLGKQTILSTPRIAQLLFHRPGLVKPYTEAVSQVARRHCQDVGLQMTEYDLEYPLWVLMQTTPSPHPRLEHLGVANAPSGRYPLGPFDPCVVISIADGVNPRLFSGLPLQWTSEGVSVYAKSEGGDHVQ